MAGPGLAKDHEQEFVEALSKTGSDNTKSNWRSMKKNLQKPKNACPRLA